MASWVGVGLYTWRRRPGSRLGLLFIGAGLLSATVSIAIAGEGLSYTLGRLLNAVDIVYLVALSVAFPRDRIATTSDRRAVLTFAVASAVAWTLALALSNRLPAAGPFGDCVRRCPDNALALAKTSPTVSAVCGFIVTGVTAAGLLWMIALMVRKTRSPARLRRRAVEPLMVAFITFALSYVVYTVLSPASTSDDADVLRTLGAIGALTIPFALLAGQVRGRSFAAASLGQILLQGQERALTVASVQTLIADALGDPTLELAIATPDRTGYANATGEPVQLPDDPLQRAVMSVSRSGRPVAAVIHDPALGEDRALVEALVITSLMLLENTQLRDDLAESRTRIVTAADNERIRLERDLHDGAQQELVALRVRLAVMLHHVDSPELVTELDTAVDSADAALDQLRDLARGIYPYELRHAGPAAALEAAARRSPLSVAVDDRGIPRCHAEIEAAVYFCALEAMQNAGKHAGVDAHVTITLEPQPDGLAMTVIDNGRGFELKSHEAGVGLLNMHDRIEALGGQLNVTSSPGHGTAVHATLPLTT